MDQRKLLIEFWKGQCRVWINKNGTAALMGLALIGGVVAMLATRSSSRQDESSSEISVTLPKGFHGLIDIVLDKEHGVKVPDKGRVRLVAPIDGRVAVNDLKRFVRAASGGTETVPVGSHEPVVFLDDQGAPIYYEGMTPATYAVQFIGSDYASFEAFFVGSSQEIDAEVRKWRSQRAVKRKGP